MNATTFPHRPDVVRPELAPLLSMLFLMIDELRSIVVHVTSANPREGATTVARDIAAAAAAAGWCQVALVDAHRAEPRPLGAGVAARPGLIEYFDRGEMPILNISRLGSVPVATGKLSTASQPVSRPESVRGLYTTLRSQYALVVVDCPPVLAGQQTLVLAPAADGTILVIEAEHTPVAQVERAKEILGQLGSPVLGAVLNKRRARIPNMIGRLL